MRTMDAQHDLNVMGDKIVFGETSEPACRKNRGWQ